MPPSFSDIVEEARLSARALWDYGDNLFNPTVRLGVTGLVTGRQDRIHHGADPRPTRGGRFPVFEAFATGRIARARLEPQPDDAVPRFDYENHVRTLIEDRRWPNSTVDISELRLVIDYQRHNGADRTLTLDIVDYPGEWLLDLPLLQQEFRAMVGRESRAVAAGSAGKARLAVACAARDAERRRRARTSRRRWPRRGCSPTICAACRDERFAMSLLPPGRFLMPGSLAGSPALTFAPLDVPVDGTAPEGSLWAMMVRRYEAYKQVVVRPFFRDHFARLDRQVVLVDALSAFNAGPEALRDLEAALAGILECFRTGRGSLLSNLFRPRIDRILFAATKADHLHQSSHDRLEAILRRTVAKAAERAEYAGAVIDVVALAAVRATREAQVARGRDKLPSILGTPAADERHAGETFDGNTEVATFPGDLPADPEELFTGDDAFRGLSSAPAEKADFRFLRFRPPLLDHQDADGPTLPHIRLDRALQFLIGDRLQ